MYFFQTTFSYIFEPVNWSLKTTKAGLPRDHGSIKIFNFPVHNYQNDNKLLHLSFHNGLCTFTGIRVLT